MAFYVYLLASRRHGTLYLGVTSDLERRVYEHKTKLLPGFTARDGAERLVWYEVHDDPTAAIKREKTLKKWRRDWKINLIEAQNPDWHDLLPGIGDISRGHSGVQAQPARPEPMNTRKQ